MQTEPEQPDLFPVPPAVAWTYARAVELALRQGNRMKAFAAVERAFEATADIVQMPDEVPIDDVLQSGSMSSRLKAKGVMTLGHLCSLTVRQLQKTFHFSDQAVDRIQGGLEEIGRRLEG